MRLVVRRDKAALAAVAAVAVVAALALLGACTGSSATVSPNTVSPSPGPTLTPDVSPTPMATPTSSPTPAPTPTVVQPPPVVSVSGLDYPLAGACLPTIDNLMPNAPRLYRFGIHEGVDFYPGLACAEIVEGTSVLAAEDGTVVRAGLGFSGDDRGGAR